MNKSQRHEIRDAIDRALRELMLIPFTPPNDVERMLQDVEHKLGLIKKYIVEVYG